MRIEKINDKQIRVVITNKDLTQYHITTDDLKYGNKVSQEFFKSIMETAKAEYGFNPSMAPVAMEAIPLKNSVMIVMTIVEDAEEADPAFASFRDEEAAEKNSFKNGQSFRVPKDIVIRDGIMECANIDNVISVSVFSANFPGTTWLYRAAARHAFYYVFHRPEEMDTKDFLAFLNAVSEFGTPVENPGVTLAYLKEHEKPVKENPHLTIRG